MNATLVNHSHLVLRRIVAVSSAIAAGITAMIIGPRIDTDFAGALVARSPHWPDFELLLDQPLALQMHVLAALAAVGLGAALMLHRKGKTFHRIGGWVWSALLMTVALSSLFIFKLDGTWSYLHLFSGWVIVFLPLAVLFARRHHIALHRTLMMVLFFGSLLISGALAFLPGRLMWRLLFG